MENTSFGAEKMTRNTTMSDESISSNNFYAYTMLVTIILGLIGNGIVIILTCCRMKATVNSIWFLNLAIADFIYMFSLLVLLGLGKQRTEYIDYNIVIMLRLNLFASVFFLVVISLDRCLCTWKAVWAQNNRTVFRARIICVIVWVSSIGCSLPHVINPGHTIFLVTFEFTVGFFTPFLIIASSYIAIALRIKRLKMGKHLRSYRLITSVILSFFICYFPSHICSFCFITRNCGSNHQIMEAYKFCLYLINLNICLNPFLYVFMCDDYKKKLKQSLLLVLETAFAEDHLNIKVDTKGQETQT